MKDNQGAPAVQVLSETESKLPATSRRAWLLSLLQRRPDLLARLAYYRDQLLRLPRTQRRWLLRRTALPLSAVALMLALSGAPGGLSAAPEATITVAPGKVAIANDGLCSLIEAINNANAASGTPHADCVTGSTSGADTIVLPTNGTFNLTTYDNYGYYGYNGLPEIKSTIIVEGNGSTIARTGKDEFRIFAVEPSGDLTLNDVTLTGGASGYYYGGAISVREGSLTINDSTLTGNKSSGGGAVYVYMGDVTVNGSSLSANDAYGGGAISSSYSTLTISDSELKDNVGVDSYGGGAAIYSRAGEIDGEFVGGDVTITNTTISGNVNDGGGAISMTYGALTMADSTVTNNTTKFGYGAGLYLQDVTASVSGSTISGNDTTNYSGAGVAAFDGTLTISDSLINNNTSGYMGAGVLIIDTELTINQTTISNNSAGDMGGGVMIYSGEALIVNSTISGNKAPVGAGVYNGDLLTVANSTVSANEANDGGGLANINGGQLTLVNATVTGNMAKTGNGGGVLDRHEFDSYSVNPTREGKLDMRLALITGNTAGVQGPQVHSSGPYANVVADEFNLFGASGAAGVVGFSAGSTDIVPTGGVGTILGALADNGGPTLTHALVANSPAIDAGPTTSCAVPPIDGRDQRGEPRSRNADGVQTQDECDLGAFEAPGTPVKVGFDLFLPVSVAQ